MAKKTGKKEKHAGGFLWQPEHDELLLKLHKQNKTWVEVAKELNKKFPGFKRTDTGCSARLIRLGLRSKPKKASLKPAPIEDRPRRRGWSADEDTYLAELYGQGLATRAIRKYLNQRFDSFRSVRGIEKRIKILRTAGMKGFGPRLALPSINATPSSSQYTPQPDNSQRREVALTAGDAGSIRVILEGPLSQDGDIQKRARMFISEALELTS